MNSKRRLDRLRNCLNLKVSGCMIRTYDQWINSPLLPNNLRQLAISGNRRIEGIRAGGLLSPITLCRH